MEIYALPGFSSYQWKKDGVLVTDGGSISGATTATLVIDPLSASDSGRYVCTYDNGLRRSFVDTDGFNVTVSAASAPAMPIGKFGFISIASTCILLGGYVIYKRRFLN